VRSYDHTVPLGRMAPASDSVSNTSGPQAKNPKPWAMLSWPFEPKTCLYPSNIPPKAHSQFRKTPFSASGNKSSQTESLS
jgi:hypothetical protein